MKERLVEDWLTRINERGYELPFCQALLSQGFQILRCGHSPTEHGKDVLALGPDGAVYAYQLKTGDLGQSDITNYHAQITMLVETRPIHPGLPTSFNYRPFFVTTGEFKDPAISLVKELNAGWQHRQLPSLTLISGKQLLVDFIKLSADFWPLDAPDVRQFRELYLTDGRGDLEIEKFSKFISQTLKGAKSGLDLERRAAAVNLFSSYLLGEFYKHEDHWSIVRGWTICASHIAWAGLSGKYAERHWIDACKIAKDVALVELEQFAKEVLKEKAFAVIDREIDEYTRVRNTTALSAAACWQLISNRNNPNDPEFKKTLNLLTDYVGRGRLYFWGEGAMSQFLILIWMLERGEKSVLAHSLLLDLIKTIAEKNSKESADPYEDPYISPDECLTKLFDSIFDNTPNRQVVESYSLFPMIMLAVKRNLRNQLTVMWKDISDVLLTWFRADEPEDFLLWRCDKGKEFAQSFARPQSWKELQEFAFRDDNERIPKVLRDNIDFAIMYSLVFQHRTQLSLFKFLDSAFSPSK